MKRILVYDNCLPCKRLRFDNDAWYCRENGRKVPSVREIPPWCPSPKMREVEE